MMNGGEVEMEVFDFEENGIGAARETPLANGGSLLPRTSRKKRYVAFPEGSSFSVSKYLIPKI